MKLSDEHFEQLTAYLDGELNDRERREVEALLARDPQARAMLESLRQVSSSVAALPRVAAPTGLSAAVQERMARSTLLDDAPVSQQDLPRLVIWTNRLAVAACLALVCTAGWLGIEGRGARGPAVALNESKRIAPAMTDHTAKESANKTLAFDSTVATPQPVLPTAAAVGRIESTTPSSIGGTMIAFRDAGDLEKRLNRTGVSNIDIQKADLSSISNQLIIETDDPEARDEIVKVVEDFAKKKRIPDVNSKRLPEPVQAQQSFYVVSQAQNKQSAMPNTDETWIGVNAPMKVTHELMDCVNNVALQKKGPMQVEVNGCRMETPSQATQILAANYARNNRMLQDDSRVQTENAPVVSTPPAPAAGMLVDGSTRQSTKNADLKDDEAVSAKRQVITPPGSLQTKAAKSSVQTDSAEAGKDEPKPAAVPTEGATRRDKDDGSNAKEELAGRQGGKDTPSRGGFARDSRAREEKLRAPPPASVAAVSAAPPATPATDGCVTLSICVRNANVQRGRIGQSTSTQASDTIRSAGATSMPQTSMPAAGAARE